MSNDPPFEDLFTPEVAKDISSTIRSGLNRIESERKMARNPFTAFDHIDPDKETVKEYILSFFILLDIIESKDFMSRELSLELEALGSLCELLESGNTEEVVDLINNLKGQSSGGKEEDDVD